MPHATDPRIHGKTTENNSNTSSKINTRLPTASISEDPRDAKNAKVTFDGASATAPGRRLNRRQNNSFLAEIMAKDDEFTIARPSNKGAGKASTRPDPNANANQKKTSFNRLQVRVKTLTLRKLELKLQESCVPFG
jgi:hypothetical protein